MKRSIKILSLLSLLALSVVLLEDFIDLDKAKDPQNQISPSLEIYQAYQKEPITPIPESLNLNSQKVQLGEQLFHDPNLSHDKTLSCATCHNLKKGGADGLPHPNSASLQKASLPNHTVFNSPTIFNATFNFVQGWEGKAKNLKQQIAIPLFNHFEMGNKNWDGILTYLNHTPHYKQSFQKIYNAPISSEMVVDVISEFERSLITPNSPFDLYLKGQSNALSRNEQEGYRLFKKRGCIACHQGINIGGNLYQKTGIFKPMHPSQEHKPKQFKVPSLRNIALTAPYFHDGAIETLEEAINLMAEHQLGLDLPLDENQKIQAFLKTLTGQYKGQSLSYE